MEYSAVSRENIIISIELQLQQSTILRNKIPLPEGILKQMFHFVAPPLIGNSTSPVDLFFITTKADDQEVVHPEPN